MRIAALIETARPETVSSKTKAVFWAQPLRDYIRLLEQGSKHFSMFRLLLLLLTAIGGWWMYVPAHELLHAFGCLWSGGEVTRLELAPEYGAAWLQSFFPWLAVGSDYAGQLTGFNTRGSDLIYLVTVLAPYVLTLFPGMTLWTFALTANWQSATVWALTGLSFSMVAAPFISIFGDMYEAASIITTRGLLLAGNAQDPQRWRSDDMFLLLRELAPSMAWLDVLMLASSLLLAVLLAWIGYWMGRRLAVALFMLASKDEGV
jgi:hypothetical protein